MLMSLALLGASAPLAAQQANRATPGYIRVRIDTSVGAITVALDARRAPKSTANFLAYADDGRFDGTLFYRAARSKRIAGGGFVEGGTGSDLRRELPPIPLEPTSKTGLRHIAGTISMARSAEPNSAAGDFSLLASPSPNLDARGTYLGYAAFGQIVAGMDVLKRILSSPTHPGGAGPMAGQLLIAPIKIVRVVRLDGTPKPTGQPKVWQILSR